MSTDRMVLEALATKTKNELRYFELVTIKFLEKIKKVYLCVGKHALYLVRRDLSKMFMDEGGEIYYAHVDRVVEDNRSKTDFLLVLNDNRNSVWDSPNMFVVSDNRAGLLDHMAVCYIADKMWRFSTVVTFPRFQTDLRKSTDNELPVVQPFKGFKTVNYQGYQMFVQEGFQDLPNAVASTKTGAYKDDRDIEIMLHIHEPIQLSALEQIGRDHIRWVAMEYKQSLTVNLKQFYMIRNMLYLKKMNLSDDLACWMGWELFLKTEDYALAVVLLRRQYVPPLMDSAQDFAVMYKCPKARIDDGKITDQELLQECHMAADTFSTESQTSNVYREMIQAKLDALLFDEEAYRWIESRLKLVPNQEGSARQFIKAILKLLSDESALQNPDLLTDVGEGVPQILDAMSVPRKMLDNAEGIDDTETPEMEVRKNAWYARVARYLAFSLDGGLLGTKFSLFDIIDNMGTMTPETFSKLRDVLAFLLHWRPKDFTKKWLQVSLAQVLKDRDFMDYTFNDRVMQVMLELGYIQKMFPKQDGKGMSLDYAKLLANLISSEASINLKASICRQIISSSDMDQAMTLCPALIHLMKSGGLFLATYASAALVNMSGSQDSVKNLLMSSNIAHICLQQLKSKDDDLIQYTLVLLVNLTKSVHHRAIIKNQGTIPVLIDILTSSYSNKFKHKVLSELSSVLGQMCNDEDTRRMVCEMYPVVECLLYVFDQAPPASKIMSKVIFALKQLCANSPENKEQVGAHVIAGIVPDLGKKDLLLQRDWATNAIMLLMLLCISKNNCNRISDAKWDDSYKVLSASQIGSMDATRERLMQIEQRIRNNLAAGG